MELKQFQNVSLTHTFGINIFLNYDLYLELKLFEKLWI